MSDPAELEFFDGRAYRLMVTMHADTGEVRIEHQAGSDAQADTDMAMLAAEIVDQIGCAPVARAVQMIRCRAATVGDTRHHHPDTTTTSPGDPTVTAVVPLPLFTDLPDDAQHHRQRAELLAWVRMYAPALHQLAMDEVARLQLLGRLEDDRFRDLSRDLAEADPREWVERLPLVRSLARRDPLHRRILARVAVRWHR